jgi:hypothetical protein
MHGWRSWDRALPGRRCSLIAADDGRLRTCRGKDFSETPGLQRRGLSMRERQRVHPSDRTYRYFFRQLEPAIQLRWCRHAYDRNKRNRSDRRVGSHEPIQRALVRRWSQAMSSQPSLLAPSRSTHFVPAQLVFRSFLPGLGSPGAAASSSRVRLPTK